MKNPGTWKIVQVLLHMYVHVCLFVCFDMPILFISSLIFYINVYK